MCVREQRAREHVGEEGGVDVRACACARVRASHMAASREYCRNAGLASAGRIESVERRHSSLVSGKNF
eukprot:4593-Pleurochrysis_carterae.AAC.1